MSDKRWISPDSPFFNRIRDGQPVGEDTTNFVIKNIGSNLKYLESEVSALRRSSAANVSFSDPVEDPDISIGTPVYWKNDGAGGVKWAEARVSLKDSSGTGDTGTGTIYHWQYDDSSFASGIVIGKSDDGATVDVALYGKISFMVAGDNRIQSDDNTAYLSDLFFNGDDRASMLSDLDSDSGSGFVPESSFSSDDEEETFTSLKSGVYFLSTVSGKLSRANEYTRVMCVVTPRVESGTSYLDFFVCPEGFGGEKIHVHQKIPMSSGLAYGSEYTGAGIPDKWYPEIIDDKRYLNITLGEVNPYSAVFPYSELDNADYLYNAAESSTSSPGWLYTVSDTDKASFKNAVGIGGLDIPDNAKWGYCIHNIERFKATDDEKESGVFWKSPAPYDHVLLTFDGVPIPSTYYIINDDGIWWVRDGLEHAPIKHLVSNDVERSISLWYIAEYSESLGGVVTSLSSDRFVVTNDSGRVSIDPPDAYVQVPLAPVLPFNPMDGFGRATDTDVDGMFTDGVLVKDSLLMDRARTKRAIDSFATLTQPNQDRECNVHTGTFNDLVISGLWEVTNTANKPPDLAIDAGTPVFTIVGRFSTKCHQIILDNVSGHKTYVRTGNLKGGTWVWGKWTQISPHYNPVSLPGETSNLKSYIPLSFDLHPNRYLISRNEAVDAVRLPGLSSYQHTDDTGAWNALEFKFINEMSIASNRSVMVVALNDPLENYMGVTHLVSIGEACTEADHYMGRATYTSEDQIPNYIGYTGTIADEDLTLTSDCLAPQFYGDSYLSICAVNRKWFITGGTGVWYGLTTNQYNTLVDSGLNLSDILSNGAYRQCAIRFTSRMAQNISYAALNGFYGGSWFVGTSLPDGYDSYEVDYKEAP
jgi:hypothetical protein